MLIRSVPYRGRHRATLAETAVHKASVLRGVIMVGMLIVTGILTFGAYLAWGVWA